MRIGHDEAETGESTVVQSGEELAPERLVLGVADIEPEDFTMPVSPEFGVDHDRLGDDVTVLADVDVGGVNQTYTNG